VVTVSEYNRRHLAELVGDGLAARIIRLYNGLDLTRIQPDPSIRREPDLILAVGRLVEKKGFRYLVDACRLLQECGRSFRCLIVGKGPQQSILADQIGTLGLQDRVLLLGAQSQEQVLELMKRAAVLVLPCVVTEAGDRDALPTVLLEALALGLPVISTALAGIPEIIEHGSTGLLVPPGDSRLLAKTIAEVLASPELRERLGRPGRSKAEEAFDIRKNALILRDLFAGSAVGEEVRLAPSEYPVSVS